MVAGWRRAFCTSIPKTNEPKIATEKQNQQKGSACDGSRSNRILSFGSKFSFFYSSSRSNPSTPRLLTPLVSSPRLSCRTKAGTAATFPFSELLAQGSPMLQCKTGKSPRSFLRSNTSSPRSASNFSLLKNSLWFTKTRCGICIQSVKTGQGTAIFTAECSHAFHFPCLATHFGNNGGFACPVCSSIWKEAPLLPIQKHQKLRSEHCQFSFKESASFDLRVYEDDEPLMSPTAGSYFNPIPESDENDGDNESEGAAHEFQGFVLNTSAPRGRVRNESSNYKDIEVGISMDGAVIAVGRSHKTYAVAMRIRAPPAPANGAHRASVDLVTVLDISRSMTRSKLQLMKRAMRLVTSSLSSNDRLSIVAFSASSKRLLPLRRMTSSGKRSVRRVIDALVCSEGTCVNDALRKAAKVIEDRRERNPVASILMISDGEDDRASTNSANPRCQSSFVSSTRFSHLDIPVYSVSLSLFGQEPCEEAFSSCLSSLLNVVVSDLRLQLSFASRSASAQISAVYSCTGRPARLMPGSAKIGNLCAEEEREILLELKVPSSFVQSQHVMSVRSCYKDPSNQHLIYRKEHALLVPCPHNFRSSELSIQRLRRLFIMTRSVAESRRLLDRKDLAGAHHLLASARALLMQPGSGSADEWLRGVEMEIAELHCRQQSQPQGRRTKTGRERVMDFADEKGDPLTPISAWKAAEKLSKIAMMRKSVNRVSDLHGFENARF
ncbi:hypothetical protein Nepgr_008327 [Nepenthes gracilis]|uniref:Uncharacterized protein n=1 Tax=Nepenthes gracilis TaxID=150966 RepID=A0AAD3S8J1_NEPGR|nr:hypothetical protein Nepgr_008327 [Nepenthes gracilis]